jgi:hypothetical protein
MAGIVAPRYIHRQHITTLCLVTFLVTLPVVFAHAQ